MTGARQLLPAGAALIALALGGCQGALSWPQTQKSKSPRAVSRTVSRPAPARYTVKQGDSLYAIALKYDLDVRRLAAWNKLGDGELIFVGQKLRLRPPAHVPAPPPPAVQQTQQAALGTWLWPAPGPVVTQFSDPDGIGKGIDISGKPGDAIVATAAGKVVYSGGGLIGYGNLIIVKHNERILSAYGYNKELLVREGDQVVAGQRIARMGAGPNRQPLVHFEIRLDGKPTDPLRYLKQRQ